MHHTTDKIPVDKDVKKYKWQKKHLENQTGSMNSFKPVKIKNDLKKNMKVGNKIFNLFFFLIFLSFFPLKLKREFLVRL